MKAVIVYASVHHGNTKKIVDKIANEYEVERVDATQELSPGIVSNLLLKSPSFYLLFHEKICGAKY